MKDIKPSSLLTIAMVLIVISFTLLGIWGYYKYFRIGSSRGLKTTVIQKTADIDSKSEKTELVNEQSQSEVAEYKIGPERPSDQSENTTVKHEENKSANRELEIAQNKINELSIKIKELSDSVKNIEKENKDLKAGLTNSVKQEGKTVSINPASSKNQTPLTGKEKIQQKTAPATELNNSNVKAKDKSVAKTPSVGVEQEGAGKKRSGGIQIKLSTINAFYTSADNEERKANSYTKAEKFAGSITVKNTSRASEIIQLYLVIIRPDGKPLNSAWESGTFETAEGKKTYTLKLSFDSESGETKTLRYSIYPDKFLSGNYKLLVYYDGKLSGSARTTLN